MKLPFLIIVLLLTVTFSSALAETGAVPKSQSPVTVELYVTEWCPYCRKAQEYLKSKNIPFKAYDIEADSAAHTRYTALGGRGVPLIIVGQNRMSGFSVDKLEHLLKISR
jgi:glutaredoxin-like YruB-family protein